jgi:hypothetical protein
MKARTNEVIRCLHLTAESPQIHFRPCVAFLAMDELCKHQKCCEQSKVVLIFQNLASSPQSSK